MRDEIDGDGLAEEAGALPPSLLPYEQWIEQAYREVMIKALLHAQAEGLPGAHHFYITFRTTARGVLIPTRLLAQYPQEMTIVLQHQFWDLSYDREAEAIHVGLSFGGVPSKLTIPLASVVEFADPHIRYGLRFQPSEQPALEDIQPPLEEPAEEPETPKESEPGQVVSLDAFRRRSPNT